MSIQSEVERANVEFVANFTDGDKAMPPARHAVRFCQMSTALKGAPRDVLGECSRLTNPCQHVPRHPRARANETPRKRRRRR